MADFSVDPAIGTIIEAIKQNDPSLYDILSSFYDSINSINQQINPVVVVSSKVAATPEAAPDDVTNLVYVLNLDSITISWDAVTIPGVPSLRAAFIAYEVRRGASWNTASFVTQISGLRIVIDPILEGSTTYLVKAFNIVNSTYSVNAASVVVVVPHIAGPNVIGTAILNSAILNWADPVSAFRIDHYRITINGVFYSNIAGTFFAHSEASSGTYTYGVKAVDVAGNVGTESFVSLTVTAPIDYITQAIITSTFTGTKTNAYVDAVRNYLEVCLDTAETYADHFVNNGYATPQAQINAGFPYYGEPAKTTASYKETFDFGAIFSNVVINLSWLYNLITAASVSLASTIEFSTDNVTFTAPVTGPSAFSASVRYVRATVNFTGATNALLEFFNFQCAMAIHREMDGGSGSAAAADVGGTTFNFNKTFQTVETVTCTARSAINLVCVINSITAAHFKVAVFDTAGVRQTATIDWKARGTI